MDFEKLQQKTSEFFQAIFDEADIQYKLEFSEEEIAEDKKLVNIVVKSTDDSLLIGYHGNTLNSLQHLLNIVLYHTFKEDINISLDIGAYKSERKEKVLRVAQSAIEKARSLRKSIALYPMSAFERKLVHEAVSNTEDLTSYSEGEGQDRRVVVAIKELLEEQN